MPKKEKVEEVVTTEESAPKKVKTDFSNNKILKYKTMILSRDSQVLYLEGRPGEAKSAMIKQIASDLKLKFIDIRLAQIDESEILGVPYQVKDGESGNIYMKYAYPKWAIDANNATKEGFKGALIFFDEMNRATRPVRNGSLQILLDHCIGHDFVFAETVYFAAAGNIGDEDNCEVEEMDAALWNRLAPTKHELLLDEWDTNFAKENVHPSIVSFLKANPTYFRRVANEKERQQATPRSWTSLSNLITNTYGKDSSPREFFPLVQEMGIMCVGSSVTRYLKFLEDQMSLSINDIIGRYDQVEADVKKVNRDKRSELLSELKEIDVLALEDSKLMNIREFLKLIDPDELTAYMKFVMAKMTLTQLNEKKVSEKLRVLLAPFAKNYDKIQELMK